MFLHHCIRKVWRCYTVVAEESVIVPTSFFSSLLRKVVFGLLSLFQPFLVLPIINSWFSSFVFQDQPKVFPLRSDFYFLFWRTPSISEIKEKSCVQSCYTSNLFLSSILSLTHSSRDTWDWRITGGMKPWVGKEYISSSYNFWVIFFHLILELLFCNKGIADWIRARHAIPLAFSFGPTSFSINLESCISISSFLGFLLVHQ